MAITKQLERLYSLEVRGAVGISNGFGRIVFGWCGFGVFDDLAGIYQKKKTLKGNGISRMAFYAGSNPQTVAQQNWRGIFTAGVTQWHALTQPERDVYIKKAKRYHITGYNLYLRKWLQSH